MFTAMRASSVTRFVRKSATLIDDIVELSTVLPDEWHRILSVGGTKVSTRLRSAAGTFGKRCDDVKYVIDFAKWALRERRLAKMKFPWYHMG